MKPHDLESLGLSNSESQIYLKLLEKGPNKAGQLAKQTAFNRTTIYKSLDSLQKKGLVSSTQKENRTYFQAENPKHLIENITLQENQLKEKKKHAQKLLPQLESLLKQTKEQTNATIFTSIKGIKSVFNNLLNTLQKNDTYYAFGIPPEAEIFEGYFEEFNKILKKKKAKEKLIIDERATNLITSCKKHGHQVRTLPKEFSSPAEINIYRNNVAIVFWAQPFAIVIQSKAIAESFKQYFNLIWKIAKA